MIDGHIERLARNVERVVIPDASHEMFLDFPEESAGVMMDFFNRQ
jgi:pimeloyl-ACP methyl ester carboxylesterase